MKVWAIKKNDTVFIHHMGVTKNECWYDYVFNSWYYNPKDETQIQIGKRLKKSGYHCVKMKLIEGGENK